MKNFFTNVLKPSNNESTPLNDAQNNLKISQNSSSIQSSKSFWNDPTRVNMVNNDEIILENDRILPSLPSSLSTSGQDSAIYSFSPSPVRPYVSNVFNSTDNSQNTLLYGSKHKKDKSKNEKTKKEEDDDDGGIVLLKTRIITDDVPVGDYGKNVESKSIKNIEVKPSRKIDSNKNVVVKPSDSGFMDKVLSTFTKPSTNEAQKPLRKATSKSNLQKTGNKNGVVKDGVNDDEGLGCTSILDKIITEAKEYVDGIGSEIKKTKAPAPSVPTSSQNLPKSVSDIKLDISMFEKGKLPDLKKKNPEKTEVKTNTTSDYASKIDQTNFSGTILEKTNISTHSNTSESTHKHKTNSSGDHNEDSPINMSQFFKVGVPTFVKNNISENETSKKSVKDLGINNDIKSHSHKTENLSDINSLADRYIKENIIVNKQQKPLQIKQSFGKKEEKITSTIKEMHLETKVKHTTSQNNKDSKVNDKQLESFGAHFQFEANSSHQQHPPSVKPIEIPSIFSNQEGKFEKLQKKPMVEIPKNDFVKNQLFKNHLEKIIANPITPAKKSKSMTSLADNSNVGKEKKFKFLVEGIDIPARETVENNEETDPNNKRLQRGFAYVKGQMLADEVTKRASEVASRKPHEYVENYAIEKEILSVQKEFEEEERMRARDELHAHVRSLFKKESLKEVDRNGNINQTASYNDNFSKNKPSVTSNFNDQKNVPSTSQHSLGRRSKSDFDLTRENINISQNHSIPHDTSRVFLKPHDQDIETLKKLKKERHKYLNKKISSRGDRGESEYVNLSDSTATDSQPYTRAKNSTDDTTTNRKNKFKSRSKHKNSHNTQVNSGFEANSDYNTYTNTGGVYHQRGRQLLNRDNKSKNGLYNHEFQNFHDGFNNELNKGVFSFGEFEDLERFEFERNKHVRKPSEQRHIAHNNRGYDAKDYRSKNIVSGVISFPANLSKSLDDLHTTIAGKVTVQKNRPSGKNLKKTSHSKVQLIGPGISYKHLYHKNNKYASLPDAIPSKHQNVQYNFNRNKNMFNDNLKSDVIWEESLNADPELATISRQGQLYKVQVRLNNTPLSYRGGSSLSNRTHALGGYIAEPHRNRGAFKSTNYIHDIPPTLILPPPSEFSSHSVQNPSISTSYFQPIIYQNEVISSGVKSIQGEEERFAVKSIKSTEHVQKTPPPNGIEFDLELLQTTQAISNNVNYVSRNTNVTNQSSNKRGRDEYINRQPNNKSSLLLINNQYRNDDEYNRDVENLVKGSVLIKNSLNPKQGNHLKPRENTNLFGGHYFQARENPIYTSDFETIEEKNRRIINTSAPPDLSLEWEENGGFYKQVPINKQWYHDYIFGKHSKHNFSPRLPGPWKLRSSQNKGQRNFSTGPTNWSETKHIKQTVDVEKEEEELIGPLKGPSKHQAETAVNIDAISEKVELSLLNGIITIEVKVRCERLVPIRGTEDMFKKSAVVVTRMIDIDMTVSAERQAMYQAAVAMSARGSSSDHLRLSTKDTFELYCKLMQMADEAEEGLLFGSVHIDKELEEERRFPGVPDLFNDTTPTYQPGRSRFL